MQMAYNHLPQLCFVHMHIKKHHSQALCVCHLQYKIVPSDERAQPFWMNFLLQAINALGLGTRLHIRKVVTTYKVLYLFLSCPIIISLLP